MERHTKIHHRIGDGFKEPRDFQLRWGHRKRLRCMKVPVKAVDVEKTTVRVDRRTVSIENDLMKLPAQRPSQLHVLRNSRDLIAMKTPTTGLRTSSPVTNEMKEIDYNVVRRESLEAAHEKKGSGSSSGTEAAVWPKLSIALTSKEKEEDFWAIKRSRLPQRPKKRSKFIQRALNLVSPGSWLCDLSLERYEVRERKTSKKRPRGLKAMGTLDSDSE